MVTNAKPPGIAPADLRLGVKGLTLRERRLLEGLLSERDTRNRALRITLVSDEDAHQADVLLVDARDPSAFSWARQQDWLIGKPVIWLDAPYAAPGHTLARRPVQWTVLPTLLQRAVKSGRQAEEKPDKDVRSPKRPHLLLVDDSSTARTRFRSMVAQRGCDASEAASVQECMTLLGRERYDLIFMDVMMPNVDGYEGCRRVKAATRTAGSLPVVMLTSKSSPFDRIRGKFAGCDAYLTKPVDPQRLDQVLTQFAPGSHSLARRIRQEDSHPAPLDPGGAIATAA